VTGHLVELCELKRGKEGRAPWRGGKRGGERPGIRRGGVCKTQAMESGQTGGRRKSDERG